MKRFAIGTGILLVALLLLWWLASGTPPAAPGSDAAGAGSAAPTSMPASASMAAPVEPARAGVRERLHGAAAVAIDGVVFGDPRLAVTGAKVLAYRGDPTDESNPMTAMFAMMADPMGTAPRGAQRAERKIEGPPLHAAVVAADGAFRLEDVTARDLRLTLDHTHYGLGAPVVVHGAPARPLLLEPLLGAWIVGRVEGLPAGAAAAAKVRLAAEPDIAMAMRNPRQFTASVTNTTPVEAGVAADGRFELRAVLPSPRATLVLQASGLHATLGPFVLAAGDTREVVLRAEPAIDLVVAVHAAAGAPIAGAEVLLRRAGLLGERTRAVLRTRAQTGADGVARQSDLWPGSYELEVRATGWLPHEATRELHAAGERWTVTLQEGGAVTGRVVDAAGQPVADAGIAAVPAVKVPMLGDVGAFVGEDVMALPAVDSNCRTDATGAFRLAGLETQAPFGLAAAHRDYLPALQRDVRAGQRDVTLTLHPAATVRGRVVAADGKQPVTAFTAQTMMTMMLVMSRATATARASSSDGTFALARVPPGTLTLQIDAPGFARAEKRIEVAAGQDVDAGTIELVRAASVRGFVRDENGAPVALATVKVQEGGMQDHPVLGMFRGAMLERTGRDGAFALDGIAPGKVTLVASARDFASGRSPRLELTAGQVLEDVEIRLGHGGTVRGRLLVAEGASVAGFEIVVSSQTATTNGMATPRADGTFVVENLDPGRYQVQAMDMAAFETFGADTGRLRPGRAVDVGGMLEGLNRRMVTARCTVKAGATTEITLDARDLEQRGIALAVRVLLGDQPLAEGMLEAIAQDGEGRVALAMLRDGTARLTGLAPGPLRLQVRTGLTMAPVGDPRTVEVDERAEQEVRVVLPGGRLAGRVVDDASGNALANAVVKLQSRRSAEQLADFGFAVAGTDGTFAFDGLGEGDYVVVADEQLTRGDGASGRSDVLRLGPDERREGLQLRARAGSRFVVRVVDEHGAPVARAMVLAVDEAGRTLGTMSLAFSDATGRALLGGLPAGRCRVAGRADGLAPGCSDPQEVLPGEEVEVVLRLPSGTPTTVRIESAEGRPVPGTALACRLGTGPWLPAPLLVSATPRPGEFELGPLPAGAVRFRVSAGAETFEAERVVPAGGRASFVLTAPR